MDKVQMIGLRACVVEGVNVVRGTRFNVREWLAPQLEEADLAERAAGEAQAPVGTVKDGSEMVAQTAEQREKDAQEAEATNKQRKAGKNKAAQPQATGAVEAKGKPADPQTPADNPAADK